jgi:hypothetical protein
MASRHFIFNSMSLIPPAIIAPALSIYFFVCLSY